MCLFVCLFIVFLFEPSWETLKMIFWKFGKDWTWFSWDIVNLENINLLVCLFFFIWIISRYPSAQFLESYIRLDIIMLKYCWCNMFICLFVGLFIYVLHLDHLGIPQERCFESFVKIRLDLAKIFSIQKFFTCLFVCFYLTDFGIPSGRLSKSFIKIGLFLPDILLI